MDVTRGARSILEARKNDELRAAQYVRVSTDRQEYSVRNQFAFIAKYAADRGILISRYYTDEGKSGLRVDDRKAFQTLIADVESGRADFSAILVFDVSRWGRFQDADEAAYLEYTCRKAGIVVHYCAEQFENDGSLASNLAKNVKRAMAGEYSRELSERTSASQHRLTMQGFRQGGSAGYGLRRRLVDENRQPKAELDRGEYKSLQTDRVILVPGPADEVHTVRRMYRLFVEKRLTEREIAETLNVENTPTDLGRPWTRGTVHQVLTNEKYIGNNVFNRVSFKLKTQRVRNPPELIVRAAGAFEPIVDPGMFRRAEAIIGARSRRYSDNEMLESLDHLLRSIGQLSALIIDEHEDIPSSSAYRSRFGSLLRAYQLIGYTPERDYRYLETNRFLRSLYPHQIGNIVSEIEQYGGFVRHDSSTDLLIVNDEFSVSLVIARCVKTTAGALRWKIRFDSSLRPDITIALRMAQDDRQVLDYYLLPRLDFSEDRLHMAEANGLHLDAFRVDSLEPFFDLSARTAIRRAA